MRAMKILVLALTLRLGGAQLARHVYVRWVEQRSSVLHRHELPLDTEIREAKSLEALERRYAAELDRARREAVARTEEYRKTDRSYDPQMAAYGDPKVFELRQAIEDWERKSNEIRKLRYYWLVGLLALALGAWLLRRGQDWAGVSLYVLAFSEMIWCTSPYFLGGARRELTRLLDQKLLFTALALGLLAVVWRWGHLDPARPSASARSSESE